jgi:hypothetical protein
LDRPNFDDGILAFDPCFYAVLRDLDIEVFALEVGGHFNCDLEVGDSLGPFVRKLALLLLLFGFGGFVEALALGGCG